MNRATVLKNVRKLRRSPVVMVAAMVAAFYWGAAALIIAVDPLDIYPWGLKRGVPNIPLSDEGVTLTLSAATKDAHNKIFLIGGSTALGFTPDILNIAYPGMGQAVNLSYNGPTMADRQVVEHLVLTNAAPKRVVLELEWQYLEDRASARRHTAARDFPTYLYDETMANDLRMVTVDMLRLAVSKLRGNPILLPQWTIDPAKAAADARNAQSEFLSAATTGAIAASMTKHRADVGTPSRRQCADFFLISEEIVPFAKAAAKRQIAVDFLLPPYSRVLYYYWMDKPFWQLRSTFHNGVLDQTLVFRRCLVGAVAGIPGVRVFAFDNDDWLTGNLALFRNEGHVVAGAPFVAMAAAIRGGSHQLTRENIDAYNRTMAEKVMSFRLQAPK